MPRFLFFIFAKFRNDVQSPNPLDTFQTLPYPLRGTWTTPSLLPTFLSFVICYDAFCSSSPCSLPPDLSASSVGSHFLSNTPPSLQKLNPPVNAAVSQEIHIQTSAFFIATHSSYVSWSILSCNYLSTRKPLPLSSVRNSGYKCLLPWISRNLEQILKSKPIYLYLLPLIKTCSSSSQSVVSISHQWS